jgi:predicted KAP-like P-loop ATPase
LQDEDVAKVFRTTEEVNKALRALITAMPATKKRGINSRLNKRQLKQKGRRTSALLL